MRLLRNALNSLVPNWMQNAPGANVIFRTLYAGALVSDCLLETYWEGMLSAFPGVGTPTANPLIAISRGIIQGRNETNASYAVRAINYLNFWSQAGSHEILARFIQILLQPSPGTYSSVRIVTRNGLYVNLDATQAATFGVLPSFNVDQVNGWVGPDFYHLPNEITNPSLPWWSDMWIVVAPDPYPRPTSWTDPIWTNAWANNTPGFGHAANPQDVQAVTDTLHEWKGAHIFCRGVAFLAGSDPSAFVPDGTWGNYEHNGLRTIPDGTIFWYFNNGGG